MVEYYQALCFCRSLKSRRSSEYSLGNHVPSLKVKLHKYMWTSRECIEWEKQWARNTMFKEGKGEGRHKMKSIQSSKKRVESFGREWFLINTCWINICRINEWRQSFRGRAIRTEKAKRNSLDTRVRVVGAEVCARKSSYSDLRNAWVVRRRSGLTEKGRTKNQAKGSARVLLLDLIIVLFCIVFMMKRKEAGEKERLQMWET